MMTSRVLEKKTYALLLLILLAGAPYSNSLFSPFIWDDNVLVVDNAGIREGLKGAVQALYPKSWALRLDFEGVNRYYRPLHTISSVIDYGVWGLNPFGFHLSNVLFHAANTVVVFALACLLVKDRASAFIAAAVFAVHPVHTEPVNFISSRADLLCAFFMLLSLYMYAARAGSVRRYLLSLFFFAAALLSKETSLLTPFLIAFYARMVEKNSRGVIDCVPYFGILAFYVVFRVLSVELFAGEHRMQSDLLTVVFTASAAFFDYARILFIPYPLKSYYSLIWQDGLGPRVMAGLLVFAAAGAVSLWGLMRRKSPVFFLIWAMLTIAPVMNIGALGEFSMAERYLYIPSAGLSMLLAYAFARLEPGAARKAAFGAAVAVIALFSVLTFARNRVWSDDLVFFRAMAEGAPESPLAHSNLSNALLKRGDMAGAISERAKASALAPGNHLLHFELGYIYAEAGRYGDALLEAERAVALKPDYAEGYNLLGIAEAELGNRDGAVAAFQRALEIKPGFKSASANLQRALR